MVSFEEVGVSTDVAWYDAREITTHPSHPFLYTLIMNSSFPKVPSIYKTDNPSEYLVRTRIHRPSIVVDTHQNHTPFCLTAL